MCHQSSASTRHHLTSIRKPHVPAAVIGFSVAVLFHQSHDESLRLRRLLLAGIDDVFLIDNSIIETCCSVVNDIQNSWPYPKHPTFPARSEIDKQNGQIQT